MDNNIESMDNEDLLEDYEPEGLDSIAEPFKLNCYFYRSQNKKINSKNQGLLFGNGYKNIVFLHKDEFDMFECAINEVKLQKNPNINSSESASFLYKKIRQLQIEGTCEFLNEDEWFVSIGRPATKDNLKQMYWVSKVNPQYYYEEDEKGQDYNDPKIITKQLTDITLSDQNFFVNATGSLVELVLLDVDMKKLLDSNLSSFKIKAPRSFLPSTIKAKVIQDGNIRDLNTFSQDKIMFPLRIEPTTVDKSSNFLIPSWTKNNLRFRDIANFGNLGLTTNADFYPLFALNQSAGTPINITGGKIDYAIIEGFEPVRHDQPNGDRRWTERQDLFQTNNPVSISWQRGFAWEKNYAFGHELSGRAQQGMVVRLNEIASIIRYTDAQGNGHTLNNVKITNATIHLHMQKNDGSAQENLDIQLQNNDLIRFILNGQILTVLKNNTELLQRNLSSGIYDCTFNWLPSPQNFTIVPTSSTSDNIIGDFVRTVVSLNDAFLSGFPKAQFDANGVDPKNNMGVMKSFVINNDSSIKTATNSLIKKFIAQNAILLSPLNNQARSRQFKEKFQTALAFLSSLGGRITTDWTIKDGDVKIYNPFYIDLYSTSAPTPKSQIPQTMINLFGGMDFNDNTAYVLTDMKGSAGSEYLTWTPTVSPYDPNIYYIKDVLPNVSSLSKSKFIFDLTLKSDYAFRELNERADEKLLNTNPSLIDVNKEEYQKYLCYVPLTKDQIEPFLGLMGQYDGSGYVNRADIRKKLLPFGDYSEFEIGFSKEDIAETINQLEISGFFGGIMILTLVFVNSAGETIEIPIETTILNEIDESISRTTFIL